MKLSVHANIGRDTTPSTRSNNLHDVSLRVQVTVTATWHNNCVLSAVCVCVCVCYCTKVRGSAARRANAKSKRYTLEGAERRVLLFINKLDMYVFRYVYQRTVLRLLKWKIKPFLTFHALALYLVLNKLKVHLSRSLYWLVKCHSYGFRTLLKLSDVSVVLNFSIHWYSCYREISGEITTSFKFIYNF